MADLVKTIDDVVRNVLTLDGYSTGTTEERRFFARKIKNGRNFVALLANGRYLFAPSKFAGYTNNTTEHDRDLDDRDGGETDRRIGTLVAELELASQMREQVETAFLAYCADQGIEPSRHPRVRRYWLIKVEDHPPANKVSALEQVDDIRTIESTDGIAETEKERLIAARIGQGDFRKALIDEWHACSVTGCSNHSLLRASHIKPWRDSTNEERLDPKNGLLLTPNLDAAFDRYLITFSENGMILISKHISVEDQRVLGIKPDMRIPLCLDRKKYLAHHRQRFNELGTVSTPR
jgi:hypothetical protein